MKKINKNYFGKEFNELPLELHREIIIQNKQHYKQNIEDIIIEYNRKISYYENKLSEFRELQSPDSTLNFYLDVSENINGNYTYTQMQNAHYQLVYYTPLIEQLKKVIKNLRKELETYDIMEKIKENKKQYYYYYNKLKKINKVI